MPINIHSIVQKFPELEEKIEVLFLTDSNFRDICEDYILCLRSTVDVKSEMHKFQEQIAEYEDVQLHLEQEILSIISKQD